MNENKGHKKVLTTAIIPYYNSGATIERAVQCLLSQTDPLLEIVIVNDGSNEYHTDILIALEQKYSVIQVIHQENIGLPGARNTGIKESKGKYLLMLDADDTFDKDFVARASDKMEASSITAVVTCGVARIVNNKIKYTYVPDKLNLKDCLLNNIAPACALFNKQMLMAIGGYDELLTSGYEDWDLNIRLLAAGYRFEVLPDILFNYYDTQGSLLKETQTKDLSLRKLLLSKHKSLYTQHLDIFIDEIDHQRKETTKETRKVKSSIDYKVGSTLLKPMRWVKQLFK